MQERERIQTEFCGAKLSVIVATIAFGMGLDAMHVRSVIHLAMPRSLEEYVQQASNFPYLPALLQAILTGELMAEIKHVKAAITVCWIEDKRQQAHLSQPSEGYRS